MPDRIAIDFSAQQIDPAAIKAAGIEGVVNYVSEARPSAPWMKAVKPMPKDYADRLKAAGVQIVSNYQYGKTGDATPSDWRGGYEAGKRHGAIALANHWKASGAPWRPCYAPVDDDPSEREVRDYILPFIKGWAEIWGKEWTGVYCSGKVWDQLKALGAPATWFWQHNWDGKSEHPHHPDAHIHQVRIDKDRVGGVGVDWNIILKDDYGQWSLSKNPNPIEQFPIVNLMGSRVGRNRGNDGRLRVYLHSSEGVDWKSTARGTMQYQESTQTGSYHFLLDDVEIIQTIALGDSAWAVLDDNDVSVNICLVISSGASGSGATARENAPKTRAQWLEHDKMLRMLRFLVDFVCRETGIPKTRVDIIGVGLNKKGVSSHNNYTYGSVKLKGYKDGTHWDIPDTFPYSVIDVGGTVVEVPRDPNAFPLPQGYYYGPLDGPEESISGQAGENRTWIDGLKRWQAAVGIQQSGRWDDATKRVAQQLQMEKKWQNAPGDGRVYEGEWNWVIKNGWKPSATLPAPTGPPPVPVTPPQVQPTPDMKRVLPLRAGTYKWGSPFGPRDGGFHAGQDFEANDGTPFYAIQSGTVQYIGKADGYGQWIVVDSDDSQGGGCIEYGHMWDAFKTGLKVGSKVAIGQLLGFVGSNGQSSGPHLHVGVWPRGYGDKSNPLTDPRKWLAGASELPAAGQTAAPAPQTPGKTPVAAEGTPVVTGRKVGDLTGQGRSDRWGVGATDLGIPTLLPNGEMLLVFGDTFSGNAVGQGDWRSPVGLVGKGSPTELVKFTHAVGGDYARQFWGYRHDGPPWRNGGFSTVLPTDVLKVGDTLYLHVMVNQGLGNVLWTEIWKSVDWGATWTHMGNTSKLDGKANNSMSQVWAWDYDPDDGYVYVVSDSFKRDSGLILRRVRPDAIGDWRQYENWGWNGGGWQWRNPTATPITPGDEKWGEVSLRRISKGKWIIGGFLASKYCLAYRVVDSPVANMYTTPLQTVVVGSEWSNEDHSAGRVAQLYGGYVIPGSQVDVDNGVGLVVSQWNTDKGYPYKAMQFTATLKTGVTA